MYAGMPRSDAARASAAAWLPEECVTTPFAASSSVSRNTALVAPRALKAPTFCKFSHLKCRRLPAIASSTSLVITGVRWILSRIRSWASRIDCMVSAGCGIGLFVFIDSVLKVQNEIPSHMVCGQRHDRRSLVRMGAARSPGPRLRSRRRCGRFVAGDDQLLAAHQDDHSAIGVLHA